MYVICRQVVDHCVTPVSALACECFIIAVCECGMVELGILGIRVKCEDLLITLSDVGSRKGEKKGWKM